MKTEPLLLPFQPKPAIARLKRESLTEQEMAELTGAKNASSART
jgi:hypothetical protein